MRKHPVENAIARMSPRDQQIADELAEQGFTDEDLYAALPNAGANRLLKGATIQKKRAQEVGAQLRKVRSLTYN